MPLLNLAAVAKLMQKATFYLGLRFLEQSPKQAFLEELFWDVVLRILVGNFLKKLIDW